jgi:Lon protease-like protein
VARTHLKETIVERLPLFPLHTVLFPGLPLPLHIFEERYKQMIAHCLAEDVPFGVVLIERGLEAGGPAVPYRVGTAARITRLERQDGGRMNLVAIGERRFHIEELARDRLYLTGSVTWLTEGEEEDVCELSARVRESLAVYLAGLFHLLDQEPAEVELPDEPTRLSYITAAILQVGIGEKQRLLEAETVRSRLETELELIARQSEVQDVLAHLKPTLGLVTPIDPFVSRRQACPN